jgi:hypothetical protein
MNFPLLVFLLILLIFGESGFGTNMVQFLAGQQLLHLQRVTNHPELDLAGRQLLQL